MPYTEITTEFYHDFAIGDVIRWTNSTEQSYEILYVSQRNDRVLYDVRGLDDGSIYPNIAISPDHVEKFEPPKKRRMDGIQLTVDIKGIPDDPDVRLALLDQFRNWITFASAVNAGKWSDGTYAWLDQDGEYL